MIPPHRKSGDTNGHGDTAVHSTYPAKKSLGQNFLVDENIARKIVDTVSASPADSLVEIGPGKGALTGLLANTGARIVAIEKDGHLAEDLRTRFSGHPNVQIVSGDFLEYEFGDRTSPVKVVGNIPYNLTSRIISRLVDNREKIDSAVLMMQDEVASRLAGLPGTKEYGAISVRLQLVAAVEKLFLVSPGCFRPRPRVDSRLVQIVFQSRDPLKDEDGFVMFVKGAFGMRRKMFRHFVASRYGKGAIEILEDRFKTGRIETFAPDEIYSMFVLLEKHVRP